MKKNLITAIRVSSIKNASARASNVVSTTGAATHLKCLEPGLSLSIKGHVQPTYLAIHTSTSFSLCNNRTTLTLVIPSPHR